MSPSLESKFCISAGTSIRYTRVQLNGHLKRMGVKKDSSCPLCACKEESVALYLCECQGLDDLRAEFLPSKPNFKNTLYGTEEQLANTHTFHVMAMSRRASAQWLLVLINKQINYKHTLSLSMFHFNSLLFPLSLFLTFCFPHIQLLLSLSLLLWGP